VTTAELKAPMAAEILAAKGFLKETEDLIRAYDEITARYFDWRARYGAARADGLQFHRDAEAFTP
jgi:hypothetical protein